MNETTTADAKLVERRLPRIGAKTFPFGLSWGEAAAMVATGLVLIILATVLVFALFKFLLPAAAPVVAVVERGGHHVVEGVRSAGTVALGAVTGGAAGAAMASSASESTPRQAPPRPKVPA
jgi:hypothetical protein